MHTYVHASLSEYVFSEVYILPLLKVYKQFTKQ